MLSEEVRPRRTRFRRPGRGLGIVVTSLLPLLGACSGSSRPGAALSSSATTVSAQQKSEGLQNASALRHQPQDPCALLGRQDITALIGSVTSKDSLRPKATVGSPDRDCVWYGESGSRLLVTVLTDASLDEYREHSKIPSTLQTWFIASNANTQLDLRMPAVKMAKGLMAPTSRIVFLLYDQVLIDAELTTTTTDAATKLPALAAFAKLIATRTGTRWAAYVAP